MCLDVNDDPSPYGLAETGESYGSEEIDENRTISQGFQIVQGLGKIKFSPTSLGFTMVG